jgi:hypothetical protein
LSVPSPFRILRLRQNNLNNGPYSRSYSDKSNNRTGEWSSLNSLYLKASEYVFILGSLVSVSY